MREKIKSLDVKTRGKKTESAGLLMVAFQILMILKPDLIGPDAEKAVNLAISSGAALAVFHRLKRNRKKIWKFLSKPFNGKQD